MTHHRAALVVTVRDGQVTAAGELDLGTATQLATALDAACRHPDGRVAVELAGLTFCDCAGLRVLLGAHRRIRADGGRLVLAHPNPALCRLLRITGLDGELEILR